MMSTTSSTPPPRPASNPPQPASLVPGKRPPHVVDKGSAFGVTDVEDTEVKNRFLEFMSTFGVTPVAGLSGLFDLRRSELVDVDLASSLKGLESLGYWDKALILFKWVSANLNSEKVNKLDNQLIEQIVRILGKESQHTVAATPFDEIPLWYTITTKLLQPRLLGTHSTL